MRYSSHPALIKRARPLLGTIVRIHCSGLPFHDANRLIDTAFDEIAHIQALMSFHDPASDVSRLNNIAATRAVRVHPDTFQVIGHALAFAQASAGVFDFSIADRLVATQQLPKPLSTRLPELGASWRDIEMIAPSRIRFHRPLWIDLGGIAKGYAVDKALERVSTDPKINWCVNAGGDLRVSGPTPENIALRHRSKVDSRWPLLVIKDGALATSQSVDQINPRLCRHIHGQTREPIMTGDFLSVVAPQCMVADALTKVVMARGEASVPILEAHQATAFLHRTDCGWTQFGTKS